MGFKAIVGLIALTVPCCAFGQEGNDPELKGAKITQQDPAESMAGFEILPPYVFSKIKTNEDLLSYRSSYQIKSVIDTLLRADTSNGPIRICFIGGTRSVRERVIGAARAWELPESSLRFDFGLPVLRDCEFADRSMIRISFGQVGTWSIIGKQGYIVNGETMNFDSQRNWETMNAEEFSQIVQHEFGHAIGLYHEHQNPRSECSIQLNMTAIVAALTGAPYNLPEDYVIKNFAENLDKNILASEFDEKSIMLYSIPAKFFFNGSAASCYRRPNFAISDMDKQAVRNSFPKRREDVIAMQTKAYEEFRQALSALKLPDENVSKALTTAGAYYPWQNQQKLQQYIEAAQILSIQMETASSVNRQ